MNYEMLVKEVQQRARLASWEEAERATRATLETLAERLPETEALQLAAQLPTELQRSLRYQGSRGPVRLSLDEFYQQVGVREGEAGEIVAPATAAGHARAVLAVLNEAASAGEMDDVRAVLPKEYASLLPTEPGDARSTGAEA